MSPTSADVEFHKAVLSVCVLSLSYYAPGSCTWRGWVRLHAHWLTTFFYLQRRLCLTYFPRSVQRDNCALARFGRKSRAGQIFSVRYSCAASPLATSACVATAAPKHHSCATFSGPGGAAYLHEPHFHKTVTGQTGWRDTGAPQDQTVSP